MHATSEPAEPSSVLPPEPRSDSTITTLYRAALGPVHLSRYLPVFARFDEAGRSTTGWNWAASLCTLNWMVFRQLWGPALVYVATAEGLALLVFGVGRPLLHWPQAVEWGVVAAFFLLGCTVPGLYGNALLHADTHKKITLALTATHTLNEACALLARQASSRKRLAWLAAGNLALALAAAGAYLAMPSTDPPVAVAATPVAQVRAAPRAAPPDPPEQCRVRPESASRDAFCHVLVAWFSSTAGSDSRRRFLSESVWVESGRLPAFGANDPHKPASNGCSRCTTAPRFPGADCVV